jgi:phospholipid/cholesterol/gamma-HCH transport system permease protein
MASYPRSTSDVEKVFGYHDFSLPGRLLSRLGRLFLDSKIGQLFLLFLQSFLLFFLTIRKKTVRKQLVMQIYFTAVEALPVLSIIAVLLGTVVIIQGLTIMPRMGYGGFLGNLMVVVVIREIGPILTALFVAGRTGAAISTYLGNMQVESEIDALKTMGIDPVRYLVMPSVIGGGVISVWILTIWFNTLAITMGFLMTKLLFIYTPGMDSSQLMWQHFSGNIFEALSIIDLIMIFLKPWIFGAIVSTTACWHGLAVGKDLRQVPKATSSSVVWSFILIIIADMFLVLTYVREYLSTISGVL